MHGTTLAEHGVEPTCTKGPAWLNSFSNMSAKRPIERKLIAEETALAEHGAETLLVTKEAHAYNQD
jgi:hypothetical protein